MLTEEISGISENQEVSGTSENQEVKRRGRKPKPTTNYFDVREEEAVRAFLAAESSYEKNLIYDEFLKAPLDKMIESIIRRYKLYRKDMNFREIHHDTHSFLITKVDKFIPARNKKAYSYFGTICKNYLMGQIIKDQKEMNRKISYEDISSHLENRPDMIYYMEHEKIEPDQIIKHFVEELKEFINKKDLSDNEKKLGIALVDLFDNYENIFIGNDNNKFNKNIILLSLREMTNLTTKEIRTSLKKYKTLYIEIIRVINNQ
jgi:hypothetical protein